MGRGLIHIAAALLLTLHAFPAGAQQGVEQKLERMAAEQLARLCPDCSVRVEARWIPDRLAGSDTSEIGGLRLPASELPRGYLNAEAELDSEENTAVQLHVSVKRKVPVATRRISAGEKITPEIVRQRTMDLTGLRELPADLQGALEGREAARLIQEGSVILRSDLRRPASVEPGDPVTLIYRSGGMEIHLSCTARQARADGQSVRLHCSETGKDYVGTLINSSKARWEKTL